MEKKQKKEFDRLSAREKKIYLSVLQYFPKTSHESALDAAWQGGVKWNFMPR